MNNYTRLIPYIITIILLTFVMFIIYYDDKDSSVNNKDTIKLYKDEGFSRVYYDSEFKVYCWKIGDGLSCIAESELGK